MDPTPKWAPLLFIKTNRTLFYSFLFSSFWAEQTNRPTGPKFRPVSISFLFFASLDTPTKRTLFLRISTHDLIMFLHQTINYLAKYHKQPSLLFVSFTYYPKILQSKLQEPCSHKTPKRVQTFLGCLPCSPILTKRTVTWTEVRLEHSYCC